MIKVSVIIPVYNGERNLRQCLDSVRGQTLKEIEIICVDDGSTDASPEILREYADADPRFRIFTQKNLYAGVARNTGMAHALGEYLIFWDCDDYFDLTALEKLYGTAAASDADICVCSANQYLENRDLTIYVPRYLMQGRLPESPVFNIETWNKYILNFTNAVVWNKLYRRRFIEESAIQFKPIRNGNDVYFSVMAMCLAKSIVTIDEPLIYYRTNQAGSLVGTLSKSPLTPIRTWMDVAEDLQKQGAFPEQSFANAAVRGMTYLLRNITEKEAFYEAVSLLKDEGLEKMHIRIREEGYYYVGWHGEFVKHLISDEADDFLVYLAYLGYTQFCDCAAEKKIVVDRNKELKRKVIRLRREVKRLKEEKPKSGMRSLVCKIRRLVQ